ncbi:uncharacterized protein CTHT_0071610 [Thermochaetoides thermophila DSM 1495]|uniref:Reverse transcriptase domain-containing protein n=1 Tax=Chaetomium thermophilum (strain DSM 1495 / CBS 144.50 / IMI 039719) TaxID=759272 RepID=G0SFP6_CHATD|nr:hypothetical protein CTHT_0071610 [Thermochaetoides thermophila DSM 1495]EGS17811.1 hypothetical protein CTHT_0071610 [Thermochaetoides thermophila DSM 1495]
MTQTPAPAVAPASPEPPSPPAPATPAGQAQCGTPPASTSQRQTPQKQRRWADVAAAPPRSTRNKEQTTRSHLSSADARVQPSSSDRSSSKRVFLQVDKADPSNAFWSQASPAEVINAAPASSRADAASVFIIRISAATPIVSQGRVLKPTREQRAASRKAGRAAYKAKVAECKRSTSTPAATLATPSQNSLPGEEKRSTQDFSVILSESSSDKANSSSSSLSPPDWVLVSRSKAKKAFAGRISKRAFTRSNLERAVSHGLLELAVRHKLPLVCVQEPEVIRGKVRRHPGFTTNPGGELLTTWIAAAGLVILNPSGETHNRGSVLDLALGPPRAFARFAHWVSDHRALLVSVPTSPPQRLPPPLLLPFDRYEAARAEFDAYSLPLLAPSQRRALSWMTSRGWYTTTRYYQEKIAQATTAKDWGRILRWRNDPMDERPSVINVAGATLMDTEDIAAYMAREAFRPATVASAPIPEHAGPRLSPHIADALILPAFLQRLVPHLPSPETIARLAADFCTARSFSFRWARSTFRTDSGLPQGSPWSPILFVLFTLPLARPSQGAAFAYMDDYAQHTWSRDPFQLVYHPSLRASELCEKARGLGLRIDPRKTNALYIPPRGRGATKSRMDSSRIRVSGGGQDVVPSHSIKWLGVTLDSRLSLKAQVSARASATTSLVGGDLGLNVSPPAIRSLPDLLLGHSKNGLGYISSHKASAPDRNLGSQNYLAYELGLVSNQLRNPNLLERPI